MSDHIKEFRKKVEALPRERILDMIRAQDVGLIKQINRIEWVFANKMTHLNWGDGTPIEGRPMTNEELALLLDPPFMPDKSMTAMGLTIDQQRQVHIASDPVLWAKHFMNATPRVYQILMLRHPNTRKVLRAGRRLGKTWSMAVMILHYAFTHKNGRVLVMAPMKPHVGLIYEEVRKLAAESKTVTESITRSVTSPQYEIQFSNGSTVKFFTTGLRSGGKSDVARGQEAHLIILDELDYMGTEDLDALFAMLQQTDDNQPDKMLVGASTPTGRRERFYQWCHGLDVEGKKLPKDLQFTEFYFPSYCNPHFTKKVEREMRVQYGEMGYRHEIEADWGEDVEGVYPRRFVDQAFVEPGWEYVPGRTSARSTYLMGVDWDKYGAGPNIVVLEACQEDYEDERFQGKLRVVFREEIPRSEYVLTQAVDRIIELNQLFQPKHIYVDRGFGEVQVELLHKFGVEHPETGLKKKVKGISFAESLEMKDPASKQTVKKDMKVFLIDNLSQLLENGEILFPIEDEDLYLQLISYVVVRTTAMGKPVFEASGSQVDHAHDALVLACLAYTQNYSDLMKLRLARRSKSISNAALLPTLEPGSDVEEESRQGPIGSPVSRRRRMTGNRRRSSSRPIVRRSF